MKNFTEIKVILSLIVLTCATQAQAEKVVIVGAGLSGLTTAYRLQKAFQSEKQFLDKSMEVEVFEAKDRPGGRVFTVNLHGFPAELGGENLNDGGDARVMHQLVKEMGLQTRTRRLSLGDTLYSDPKTNKIYPIFKDLMPAFAKISSEDVVKWLKKSEKQAKNLDQVITLFFQNFHPKNTTEAHQLQLLREIVSQRMKSYEGGETHNLATRYAHGSLEMTIKGLQSGHKALQSDKLRLYSVESVEGGNSRLILALAKTLGSKLHLNSPLKELRRSANQGFELVFGGTQAQTVRADRVVLTFPCSVYPSIQFGKATLPPERLARIAAIPYGSHAKILIHVPPNAPHTSISTDGLTGWINSEMQHATLFLSGDKGIMTNEQAFLKNLKWGSEIFSQAGIDLNPTRVQVPQTIFSSHSEAVGISWTRDPFIQGSYSYISPATTQEFESNQDHQGETILPLFAPIAGKIFFAGEHTTTEQDIRGTMEAAAASGEQAFRLLTHQLKQDFGAVL